MRLAILIGLALIANGMGWSPNSDVGWNVFYGFLVYVVFFDFAYLIKEKK